jgi:hypothetical protein
MVEEVEQKNKNGEGAAIDTPAIIKEEASNLVTPYSSSGNKGLDNLMQLANTILHSKLSPHKTAEGVATAILLGRDLGLKDMVAVNNIYNIEGKATVGIHIISALLIQNKIYYEVLKDFETVCEYGDNKKNTYSEDYFLSNLDKYELINKDTPVDKYDKNKIQVVKKLTGNVETIIKFRRFIRVNNQDECVTFTQKLSWADIILMNLHEKMNWQKMPKIMLRNRCLAIGARFFAPDVLLGLMEHTEILDNTNTNYNVTEDGGKVDVVIQTS